MKRILSAAVLLAFLPTANAADKKSEFSTNAEFRARYLLQQNASGDEETIPGTLSGFNQRFKVGLNYRANEKVSAVGTLLHNTTWGNNGDNTPGFTAENAFIVNEAYANWMISDDMTTRIGRQNFAFGDGNIMGVNDWEATPYTFDGVSLNYEMEAGTIKAFGFKIAELTFGNATNTGGDPEHNMYGVSFDLKTKPEILKMVNVHVIKNNRSTNPGLTGPGDADNLGELGQDLLRYGVTAGMEMSSVDFKLTYAKVTGDYIYQDAAGDATEKVDGDSDMMHVNLGFSMEAMMKSRFGAIYHKDSGEDDQTASATGGVNQGQYTGFFYEKHENAGLMDLINWGNLTYMGLEANMSPMDNTTVGIAYLMFETTENGTGGGSNVGTNGENLFTGLDSTADEIGTEIDVWATHAYDDTLSTMARIGYFTPGDALKSTTNGGPGKSDKVMQFFLQAKMTF